MLYGVDLFSGIGGLTRAVAPWVHPIAYCEADRYCQSVLLSRMGDGQLPVAPIWSDIRSLMGNMLRGADALSAGFPCQDISIAGTRNGRLGLAGKRSGLFWEVVRITDELRPLIVFLENVAEAKKYEQTIRTAFEHLGYRLETGERTVYSVGGFHQRKRWFAIAYDPSIGVQGLWAIREQESYALCIPRLPLCTSDGQWEIEPDLCRITYGVPNRLDRIKALGNSVFAEQARQEYKEILNRIEIVLKGKEG